MSIGAAGYYTLASDYQYIADSANNQQNRATDTDGAGHSSVAHAGGRTSSDLPPLPPPSVRDYDCSRAIHDFDDASFDDAEEYTADNDAIAGPDARSEAPPSLQRSGSVSSIASSHSAFDGSDASWTDHEDLDTSDVPLFDPIFDDVEGPLAALRQLNAAEGTDREMAHTPRRASVDDQLASDNVRGREVTRVDFEGPFAALQRLNDAVDEAPDTPRPSRPPHRVAVDDELAISNMSQAEAVRYLLDRVRGILANLPETDSDDE